MYNMPLNNTAVHIINDTYSTGNLEKGKMYQTTFCFVNWTDCVSNLNSVHPLCSANWNTCSELNSVYCISNKESWNRKIFPCSKLFYWDRVLFSHQSTPHRAHNSYLRYSNIGLEFKKTFISENHFARSDSPCDLIPGGIKPPLRARSEGHDLRSDSRVTRSFLLWYKD